MSTLSLDTLEVASFETTVPEDAASPISNNPLCDSPWCAQTIDRDCYQEAEKAGY